MFATKKLSKKYVQLIPKIREDIKIRVKSGVNFIPCGEICTKFNIGYPGLYAVLKHMVVEDTTNKEPLWSSWVATNSKTSISTTPGICGDWFFDTARRLGHKTGIKQSDFMFEQRRLCKDILKEKDAEPFK
jgi:hypothetical protein